MEFERLEPFGAWRDNWHSATIASILFNAHRDPRKPAVKMDEFFYKDPQTMQDTRDQQTLAMFQMLAVNNDGE